MHVPVEGCQAQFSGAFSLSSPLRCSQSRLSKVRQSTQVTANALKAHPYVPKPSHAATSLALPQMLMVVAQLPACQAHPSTEEQMVSEVISLQK